MPFGIYYTGNAARELGKLNKNIAKRIKFKLEKVRIDPTPFVKRLKGVELYSLRVGDYRILMNIEASTGKIIITRIGHRKNVYEGI
jgi:mRNA interferase RelE/StbE